MAIYDFFLSRNNAVSTPANYVGHNGRLFYNSATGELRLSDGTTPGGLPVPITLATATTAGSITPGPGFTVTDGELGLNAGPSFYLDETNMFRLAAGTDTQIGGVKSGNGIIIANDGTINLDTEGLSFVFGDFFATTIVDPQDGNVAAVLSSVNANEGIVIAADGIGKVQVVGTFHIHPTDADVAGGLANDPLFMVDVNGFTTIRVPTLSAGDSGLLINGNGESPFPTTVPGVSLRSVGNDGMVNTVAIDSHGTGVFSSLTLRSSRGTGNTPTTTQSGDVIGRITGVGFGTSTFSVEPMTGRAATDIRFIATENFTDTNSGTKIDFYTSPNGGTVRTLSASIGPAGITANLTGNVSGNVTGTMGTFTNFSGKYVRNYRDAGVIADGGTLTVDFATDGIIKCEWDNGFTFAYSNYTAGSVVKVIAYKRAGTGTDNLSLDGITAGYVSSGSTTVAGTAGQANFVEFTCTGTTIGSVFAKL